jgi:ribonuclease HI
VTVARRVEIYTDGACTGNPGPGGWAALLRTGGHEKLISGAEPQTTNNRMELAAAIEGLAALKRPSDVVLHTDSQYLQRGITEWVPRWKKNGWMTSGKEPVRNRDLWERLDALVQTHRVEWRWVRGHSGHVENERVDQAARAAIASVAARA